jgi:hypothetical protein
MREYIKTSQDNEQVTTPNTKNPNHSTQPDKRERKRERERNRLIELR